MLLETSDSGWDGMGVCHELNILYRVDFDQKTLMYEIFLEIGTFALCNIS
jgi:hypothetical protein